MPPPLTEDPPHPGAPFFVLPTPLLSVDVLVGWSDGLGARTAWERGEPLEPVLAADRKLLRERLLGLFGRPEVREAVRCLAEPR